MELCSFEQCTGCTACQNACSRGCISMHPDQYGFLHPKIDANTCINCGKCRAVCPIINEYDSEDLNLAFAATHHSRRILNQSSSGGVFSAIAQWCIDQGGVVYGAAFDKDFQVHHVAVSDRKDIALLRGAKYVQSNLGKTFSEIRMHLEKGKVVLFSGTPCQTAGLCSFLGKSYEKLFLIDIICHSVPSPYVWEKYLEGIENRLGEQPIQISFRNKRYGWESYCVLFRSQNNSIQEFGKENRFIQAFQNGLISRESCSVCQFKGKNHVSDITLGDFWGCAGVAPKAYCEYGTSLVIAHSQKGVSLLKSCQNIIITTLVDSTSAVSENPAYSKSSYSNSDRQDFMRIVKNDGFENAFLSFREEFSDLAEHERERIERYYSLSNRIMRSIIQGIKRR